MQTYDFKKVSVIADSHITTGYMDGSVITTEKLADNITPHVGADGEVTITENNDNTGTITLNLKQNSPSLAYYIGLANAKREFACRVIDSNTRGVKVGGTQCRVQKTPGVERGAEITGVEIVIFVGDYTVS